MKQRIYPAKLLLFGEYTIIKGSRALAVPYPQYSGQWAYAEDAGHLQKQQQSLRELLTYMEELQLQGELLVEYDLASFRRQLEQGLVFESDIPLGYGAGSSGALSAAVFDAFAMDPPQDPALVRGVLAELERFFHGSSSGTDPLVCWLNKPVLLEGGSRFQVAEIPEGSIERLFLLDTGIARETGPFVELFLEKFQDASFAGELAANYIPLVDQLIDLFLGKTGGDLRSAFRQLSHWQQLYFSEMIPQSVEGIWEQGLSGGSYALKICGAGGGGFLLGYTEDADDTYRELEGWDIHMLSESL